MLSLKHAFFPAFSLPFFWSFFLSPDSFSRAYLIFYFDKWEKERFAISFLATLTKDVQRWAEIRAALLTPLSGFSVYRSFLLWHLRRGREGSMWSGSKPVRNVEGRGQRDGELSRRSDSIWKSAPVCLQDNRSCNI